MILLRSGKRYDINTELNMPLLRLATIGTEPYTTMATFDEDEFYLHEKGREPLLDGEVIEYWSPIFHAGDRRGYRQATVTAIRPGEEFPLTLDNGEQLPKRTNVRRVKTIENGELLDHKGIFRPINYFKMIAGGKRTASAGVVKEAERFSRVAQKNVDKVQEKANAEGFAPMDMLVTCKKKKKKKA